MGKNNNSSDRLPEAPPSASSDTKEMRVYDLTFHGNNPKGLIHTAEYVLKRNGALQVFMYKNVQGHLQGLRILTTRDERYLSGLLDGNAPLRTGKPHIEAHGTIEQLLAQGQNIQALQRQIRSLETKLTDSDGICPIRYRSLETSNATLTETVRSLEEQCRRTGEESLATFIQSEEYSKELAECKSRTESLTRTIEDANTTTELLMEEKVKLFAELETLKQARSNTTHAVIIDLGIVTAANNAMTDLKRDYERRLRSAQESYDEKSTRLAERVRQLETTNNNLKAVNKTYRNLPPAEQIREIISRKNELEAQMSGFNEQLKQLGEKSTERQDKYLEVEGQLNTKQQEYTRLSDEYSKIQGQLGTAKLQIEELEKQLEAGHEEYSTLLDSLNTLKETTNGDLERLQSLDQKILDGTILSRYTVEELIAYSFRTTNSVPYRQLSDRYSQLADESIDPLRIVAKPGTQFVLENIRTAGMWTDLLRYLPISPTEITDVSELAGYVRQFSTFESTATYLDSQREYLINSAVLKSYSKSNNPAESALCKEAAEKKKAHEELKREFEKEKKSATALLGNIDNSDREYNAAKDAIRNSTPVQFSSGDIELKGIAYELDDQDNYRVTLLVSPEFETINTPIGLELIVTLRDMLKPYGRTDRPITVAPSHGAVRIDINYRSKEIAGENACAQIINIIDQELPNTLLGQIGLKLSFQNLSRYNLDPNRGK